MPVKVRGLQTNRIATIGNQTPTYNAAGEMTSDGTGTGSTQYTWNAEGRIATVTPYGGATTSYVYDGDGHLVAEGTTQTLFWYGAGGKLLGVTGGSVNIEWIYFDGRRIAKFVMAPAGPWGAQFYDNADGSLLLETDGYGNTNCRANYDPFGDPVGSGCQAYESFQYAGLYTDGASGNDLATHRQLSDTYYRWLSPDPSGRKAVSLTNPQTWNMYAYALDNPTSLNDPSGLKSKSKCGDVDYKACLNPNTNGHPSSAEKNSLHGSAKAVNSAQEHPVHEVAVVNQSAGPGPNGNGGKAEVVYAKGQVTTDASGKGFKAGTGAVNGTITTGGAGQPAQGRVNAQFLTANVSGKIGMAGFKHGASGSLGARVLQIGSQNSFSIGCWKVTINSSISTLGLAASGHIAFGHGFSIGGGATVVDVGASLGVTVIPPEPPNPLH